MKTKKKETSFKVYVIKEIYNGAVFERRVEMALADELDAERSGNPPDLSKAVDDKTLLGIIGEGSWMHKDLTERAIKGQGILGPHDLKALKEGGLTDAGKRTVTIPQPGTLEKPALLSDQTPPATVDFSEHPKAVKLEGVYSEKELSFIKRNFKKLKEFFHEFS